MGYSQEAKPLAKLALLLKLRYRQVVTLRKVYVVAIASWVNGIGTATLWCFSLDTWRVLLGKNIALCLITSTYSHVRTFLRLRHQHSPGDNILREPENQTSRVHVIPHRKTVSCGRCQHCCFVIRRIFCQCHSLSDKLKIILHQCSSSHYLPLHF